MKFHLVLVLIAIASIGKAQIGVRVFYEPIKDGYNIYADNYEQCPVTVKIDFVTNNLHIRGGNSRMYVLDPRSKKQWLTQLTVLKKERPNQFTYTYVTNYGDHNVEKYDSNYVYDLPFVNTGSFLIIQGYNGKFSHQNQNAIDFDMAVGTEILAIREGLVVKVVQHNNRGCGESECRKFNNFILIYHSDGTFAEYSHIKQNGSIVGVGDKVVKGQKIGYSGNVGYSTGPHLHLVVFLQKMETRQTLETKFRTGAGDKIEVLLENNFYARGY